MLRESCPDLGTGPVTESEVIGWYSKAAWGQHMPDMYVNIYINVPYIKHFVKQTAI